jgi:hypothetical protein
MEPAPEALAAVGESLHELAGLVLEHVRQAKPRGWSQAVYVVSSRRGAYLPSLSVKERDGSVDLLDAPDDALELVTEMFRKGKRAEHPWSGFSITLTPDGAVETKFMYDDARNPRGRSPAPTADPAKVVAAGLPPRGADAAPDASGPVVFRRSAQDLVIPDACICCMGPATEKHYTYAHRSRVDWPTTIIRTIFGSRYGSARIEEYTRFTFPMCAPCARHTSRARFAWAFGLFGAGLAFVLTIMVVNPYVGRLGAVALLGLVIAAGVVALAHAIVHRIAETGPDCAARNPVKVAFSKGGDYEFTFQNRAWGARFVELNDRPVDRVVDDSPNSLKPRTFGATIEPGSSAARPRAGGPHWSQQPDVPMPGVLGLAAKGRFEESRTVKAAVVIIGAFSLLSVAGTVAVIVFAWSHFKAAPPRPTPAQRAPASPPRSPPGQRAPAPPPPQHRNR